MMRGEIPERTAAKEGKGGAATLLGCGTLGRKTQVGSPRVRA
jgi:hypothetical protein